MKSLRSYATRLPRAARVAGIVLGGLVLLLVVMVFGGAALLSTEWGERRIAGYAAERLQRDVTLQGLRLRPGFPLRMRADVLRIANPEWAKTEYLLDAAGVDARVEVLPLFRGRFVVDRLDVREGHAGLERDGERATWRLFTDDGDERDRLKLEHARLGEGWIFYGNAQEDTALHIHVTGELAGTEAALAMVAKGSYGGESAEAVAHAPSIMLASDAPMKASVEARIGETSMVARGTLQASSDGFEALDAELTLEGATLAHLREVIGIRMPHTAPYRLSGRLLHENGAWSAEGMEGKAGSSAVRGSWSYDPGRTPTAISANLRFESLDFTDFGRVDAPGTRTVPDWQLTGEAWRDLQIDVELAAERIQHPPLSTVSARLRLEDAVLRVEPLAFTAAGGQFSGRLVIDASEELPALQASLDGRALDVARAASRAGNLGTLTGSLQLAGRGRTMADVMGSTSGHVSAVVSGGQLAPLLGDPQRLDRAAGLLRINPAMPLNCAVADLEVKNGIATSRLFVIDTEDLLIEGEGQVNLGAERLALTLDPHRKDPGLIPLPPVDIRGTFRNPGLDVQMDRLIARGAVAALLALVNPLLAAAPLVDLGLPDDANCGALVEAARGAGNS